MRYKVSHTQVHRNELKIRIKEKFLKQPDKKDTLQRGNNKNFRQKFHSNKIGNGSERYKNLKYVIKFKKKRKNVPKYLKIQQYTSK